MKVGVLALQGAFRAHVRVLASLGVEPREVRRPEELDGLDAIVLPGGESTTIAMMLDRSGLHGPLGDRLAGGLPVFGTCAGMILLASHIADGRPDQWSYGLLDLDVRRNAYGRQVESFETDLDIVGLDTPFHAVFIRAPGVDRAGPDLDVLACHDHRPVLVRRGPILASAFHPELTDDDRVHRLFLDSVGV